MDRKMEVTMPSLYQAASFVAVSVLPLWLSYMTAARIYAESRLIPHGVLLVSCFLLLESVAACFLSLLPRQGCAEPCRPQQDSFHSFPGQYCEPMQETERQKEERLQEKGPGHDRQTEIYKKSVKENAATQEEARQRLKENVHDYLYWQMAPLLGQEDILPLWIEIEDWLGDRHHRPKSRTWKWKEGVDVKCQDICHLIWNIAKRRGMEYGYGTNCCASFIVRLFPDLCVNVKDTTIAQNLTANPDKGCIPIDRPDSADPLAFHCPRTMRQ